MGGHALIIEADPVRAARYKSQVERNGLAAAIAHSAIDAYLQVRRLSDLKVIIAHSSAPEPDGVSFLQRLRDFGPAARVPVVFVFDSRGEHDAAARRMIDFNISVLLPRSHTMLSLQKAVESILDADPAFTAEAASAMSERDAFRSGSAARVREFVLGALQSLEARVPSEGDLDEVAAQMAELCDASIAIIWIESERRIFFKLHAESTISNELPSLRAAGLWVGVRALIAKGPLHVSDASRVDALSRSPLVASGVLGSFAGTPIWAASGRVVGAIAIAEPRGRGIHSNALTELESLARGARSSPPPRELFEEPSAQSPVMDASAIQGVLEGLADRLETGILVSDEAGIARFANRAFFAMLSAAEAPVLGLSREYVIRHLALDAGVSRDAQDAVIRGAAGLANQTEVLATLPEARTLRWHTSAIQLGAQIGRLDQVQDISQEAARDADRPDLVRIDSATGLLNSVAAREALGREIARSLRTTEPFSIAVFQLDETSVLAIEDAKEALRNVASVLRSTLRGYDVGARVDDERLLALLPCAREENARSFCRRFQREVRIHALAELPGVTISAGIAQFDPGQDVEELLLVASDALARARADGDAIL